MNCYNLKVTVLIFILLIASQVYAQHFIPVWEGNGFQQMNIYVYPPVTIYDRELTTGDEIAVFDGDYCVGAVQLQGEIEDFVRIVVSNDDPTTPFVDGFTAGNQIMFRIYDYQEQIEYTSPDLVVNFLYDSSSVFVVMGTSYVSLGVGTCLTPPENLLLEFRRNSVILQWDEVLDASFYKIYSSIDPYNDYVEDLSGVFNGARWTAPIPLGTKKFYRVTSMFED